jgi:pyruvate/2-oxoglutarate dehydrogenase complex dihydrolipoamide dehydrogenase (E3) component
VDGLAEAAAWTTRQATSAREVPARLVVLGGGVAGCELAQVYAGLGSRVVLLEAGDRLLANFEEFAGTLVATAMREQGIDLRIGTAARRVSREAGKVHLESDDGTEVVGDELLVAAGRRPRTEDIGLGTVGLAPGDWLDVDDSMLVRGIPGEWLYAAGDVNHRALLTHQGKYQARIAGDAIAARARGDFDPSPTGGNCAFADHHAVPQVVFTDPEVAAVGHTEASARAAGLAIRVVDYQLGEVAGAALFADGYTGAARLVVDEERKVVVGATFVGAGVAELLHAATIAVAGQVPLARLWHAVPAYPTISEVWLRLLEAYGL